ncbi:MAG: selenium-dependent molybdenum cofactor biosynthesis protein YqeB [Lachnospirales bacterium]
MKNLVIVKGAGDIATGVIIKLHNCGFKVLALEIPKPMAVRRTVSFCEAVYDGECEVEGVKATLIKDVSELENVEGIAVLVDENAECTKKLNALAFVDATIAKKDLGLTLDLAEVVIGVGPPFEVGVHCHAVVESNRGHSLGKIIYKGKAQENTGLPSIVMGYDKERVIYSDVSGELLAIKKLGDYVEKGDTILKIDDVEVKTQINGIVRGLIRDGYVKKGLKIADVDPRDLSYEEVYCVSDKARCIAGGVLEAILNLKKVL